jgi:anaerobic selenocysteine-containing dehydrogenase
MQKEKDCSSLNPSLTRRTFLQATGALASAAMVSEVFIKSSEAAPAILTGQNPSDTIETADDILYTVCQMCHSRCGVRAKVKEGILVKLDGNPYHPNNLDVAEDYTPARLPYGTSPSAAFKSIGRMCLKGQSGIQTVYDPYRIQHPLKRVGSRNSGRWQTISWEQAFREIADRINLLIPPGDRDKLIDPSRPELGTKRNQLAFAPGRSVEKEMSERVWKLGWGTVNHTLDHTSICEATRHVANELITWDPKGSHNSLGGGRIEGWQADILGSQYIIFFGANPCEADFPMVGMARDLMQFKRNGGKFVAVDPRFNNTAARANQWVPIIPGTDAALAMGMISWILENMAYKTPYLENTSKAAADLDGEPTWTDATYLVGTFADSERRQFQRYVTVRDVFGIADDGPVVWHPTNGLQAAAEAQHGTLDFETILTIGGKSVTAKTAFRLLSQAAGSMTRQQYSTICGISVATMESLAREFVSHGRKAAAMSYRGPVKHTNGLYNHLAIQHLNTLIGNYDYKGGCTAGAGGWNHKSGIVELGKITGGQSVSGVRIDRAKTFYNAVEVKNLFTGYPARRPWFPFAIHGNFQEIIPGIQDGYPYPIKVLITYWNAWPYSVPGGRKVWEATVADEAKLPLLVAISPVIGEVAAWADYILPDTVYLEKFSAPGVPWRVNKGTSFQRPVVGAFDGKKIGVSAASGGVGNTIPTAGKNDYSPALPDTKSVLDIHIGLAKALGLPGVGDGALLGPIVSGSSELVTRGHLHNSWDWAKAIMANLGYNAATDKYPGLSIEEILSKGGVFDNPGEEYTRMYQGHTGEYLTHRYGNIIRFFADPIARTRDSVTGQYYSGVPHYEAPKHSDGASISDTSYTYRLITYKLVNHGQGRTNINPWLMLVMPENFVEISAADAAGLQIETGDLVKVTSASNTNGITGKARVTQGLRPGVIAISHHYGHWEQHSRPHNIDGKPTLYDASRGAGIQATQLMRADARYPNVSLQEPIGASCSFYDTWVKIAKA